MKQVAGGSWNGEVDMRQVGVPQPDDVVAGLSSVVAGLSSVVAGLS